MYHTIDWEGATSLARDTDWTARAVKEAVEIRKTGAHAMNRDGGFNQLTSLSSKLLAKKTSRLSQMVQYTSTDDVGSLAGI